MKGTFSLGALALRTLPAEGSLVSLPPDMEIYWILGVFLHTEAYVLKSDRLSDIVVVGTGRY